MKNIYMIVFIIAAMVIGTSSCARRAEAQNIDQVANTQVTDTAVDDEGFNPNIDRGEMTEYNDTIKGVVYPVYLSKGGKAFIWRKSKNTGKEYKMYRPEIGKRINPEAYKN